MAPGHGPLLEAVGYRGPDEVASVVFDEIPAVLKGFTAEVLDVEPLDDERVLATVRFKGTAESTGMEIEQVFAQVFTIRDGKGVEMHSYTSKADALAALTSESKPG